MKKNFIFLVWLLACNSLVTAQSDSINWLQEVQLSDVKLRTHSGGQRLRELNDSIIRNNEPALTQLLKFNSPVMIRDCFKSSLTKSVFTFSNLNFEIIATPL